jgi:hypothetical protein
MNTRTKLAVLFLLCYVGYTAWSICNVLALT